MRLRPLATLVSFLAAVLSAAEVPATKVRLDALGGGERWLTVADEANVVLLPATLTQFGNRVLVDLIRPDQPVAEFGMHWSLTESTVIAFYGGAQELLVADRAIRYPDRFDDRGTLTSAGQGAFGAIAADLNALVAVAHDFGSWRAGFLFGGWADAWSRKGDNADASHDATYLDFRLGFGFDLGRDGTLDLAARGGFGFFEQHAKDAGKDGNAPVFGSDGIFAVGLVARADLPVHRRIAFVPYAEVGYEQQGLRQTASGLRVRWHGWNARLGADMRFEPRDGVRIYAGLGGWVTTGMLEQSGDTPLKDRQIALPHYGFAVELQPARWVQLRFGARQTIAFQHHTQTLSGQRRQNDESDVLTEFSLGTGFCFFGFTLDLLMSQDILLDGPYLLTGHDTGPLNGQAALKFEW